MKLTAINIFNTNYKNQTKPTKSNTNIYNQETSGSLSSNITVGRSLVNFKQREFELIKEDKVFIKNITEAFHLDKEDENKLIKTVISFMKEYNIKSLDDIGDDTQIDEQVNFMNKISESLNLDEIETNILLSEISDRTVNQKNYKYNPDIKFEKDFQPIVQVCKNYGASDEKTSFLFDFLKIKSKVRNLDSIFDIFLESKNPHSKKDTVSIMTNSSISEIEDIVLDLFVLAKKPQKERYKRTLTNDKFDIFLKDFQNKEICEDIITVFNLKKENTQLIMNCLQKRELPQSPQKGHNNLEIAYIISEKLDLPSKAENYILEILKRADNVSYNELKFEALYELLDNPIG